MSAAEAGLDNDIRFSVRFAPQRQLRISNLLMDDLSLLNAYADRRSEEAFRELVRRHAALVHAVARRQVGVDAHLADDIAQRVFLTLMRKARGFDPSASVVGWLYTAARFEAMRTVRA